MPNAKLRHYDYYGSKQEKSTQNLLGYSRVKQTLSTENVLRKQGIYPISRKEFISIDEHIDLAFDPSISREAIQKISFRRPLVLSWPKYPTAGSS